MSDGIRWAETPALLIAYEEHGDPDGVPVVLLHGYPDDPRCYDGVVSALAPTPDRSMSALAPTPDRAVSASAPTPRSAPGLRILVPYLRGTGPTRFRSADTPRSGEQAALGADLRDFLVALDLRGAILGGMDWGGRAACVAAALWPERVRGLVSVGGYNIQDLTAVDGPDDPDAAVRHWYQWYFHTKRGEAALRTDPAAIARRCWRLWSPLMTVDPDAFARTAASFANPDHASVVTHSYRHRHGAASGDPALAAVDAALRARPRIEVPTIVLAPDGDGVTPMPPDGADPARDRFGAAYERRSVARAGHFVPRERPALFAAAIRDLVARTDDRW